MPQITQTYQIKAPIMKVWAALTDPKIMDQWGAGPKIKMELTVGGEFSLWGGDIFGTNTLIKAPNLLEQDWFGGDWPQASKVRFELSEREGTTTVTLTHDALPTKEVANFAQGWKDYYLGPLKSLLEK